MLKAELIKDGEVIKESILKTTNGNDFFTSLIKMTEEFKISTPPIWTSYEEDKLERDGELFIDQGDYLLRICYNNN